MELSLVLDKCTRAETERMRIAAWEQVEKHRSRGADYARAAWFGGLMGALFRVQEERRHPRVQVVVSGERITLPTSEERERRAEHLSRRGVRR